MYILRRPTDPRSRLEIGAMKRWPWITCWYFSYETDNSIGWTGKRSDAKLFTTSLQASNFRDECTSPSIHQCIVQMITKKELFEAKLRNR